MASSTSVVAEGDQLIVRAGTRGAMDTVFSYLSAGYSVLSGFGGHGFVDTNPSDEKYDEMICSMRDDTHQTGQSINEDWMVVMDDSASVSTVSLADLDGERGGKWPVLVQMWDNTTDNSDLFIEKPLIQTTRHTRHVSPSLTYANIARKGLKENNTTTDSDASLKTLPSPDHQSCDTTPVKFWTG